MVCSKIPNPSDSIIFFPSSETSFNSSEKCDMVCQCLNKMIVAVVRSKWLLPGLVTSDRNKTSLVSFVSQSSTTFLSLG